MAPVITGTSYVSDDSSITISTVVTGSGDSTVTYFVADVVLDDATSRQFPATVDAVGIRRGARSPEVRG